MIANFEVRSKSQRSSIIPIRKKTFSISQQ